MPGGDTLPPEERRARGGLNPRKQYSVKKGFSILDWNLLSSKTRDLAGRGDAGMRTITRAEVRQHRSEHDAWSIYNGKVYNITPFLHYHPGGVEMLLRGAGTDMTSLFNKYHSWVNAETMVGNLCLGVLAREEPAAAGAAAAAAGDGDDAGGGAAAAAPSPMLPPPPRAP